MNYQKIQSIPHFQKYDTLNLLSFILLLTLMEFSIEIPIYPHLFIL